MNYEAICYEKNRSSFLREAHCRLRRQHPEGAGGLYPGRARPARVCDDAGRRMLQIKGQKGRRRLEPPAGRKAPCALPDAYDDVNARQLRGGPLAALCGHDSLPHLPDVRRPRRTQGRQSGEDGQGPAEKIPDHQGLPRPDRKQVPVVHCRRAGRKMGEEALPRPPREPGHRKALGSDSRNLPRDGGPDCCVAGAQPGLARPVRVPQFTSHQRASL